MKLNLYEMTILVYAKHASSKGELARAAVALVADDRFTERVAVKAMDRLISENLIQESKAASAMWETTNEGRQMLIDSLAGLDKIRGAARAVYWV